MTSPVARNLDRMLIGQSRAKLSLTRLIEMHESWFHAKNLLHRAPNALIIGPTGTGKSHAITVAAEALRIPLVVVDSTRLVAAVATEQLTFEQIIVQLVQSARKLGQEADDLDTEPEYAAERGIVFLDEFDKLSTRDKTSPSAAIQRRLLQFIEGETVFISDSEMTRSRYVSTHGILFVASGAFSGVQLNRVTAERRQATSRTPEVLKTVQPQDVVEFGFLHELVARLPVVIRFGELGKNDLLDILAHPDVSPLNFYLEYFGRRGFSLSIPDTTRERVCEEAFRGGLGARSLHQTLFPVLSALADDLVNDSDPGTVGVAEEYVLTPAEYARLRGIAFR